MELADKLKICRGKIGLTQLQIAERLNLSRKTISGWETGRSYPDIKSLVKLSEIFNISLDDLLKNDHILDYYEDQGKLSQQTNRVFFITYLSNGKLYQRYISKKHHLIPAASFCLPELDDVFLVQIISAILCMKKELPPV